MASENEVKSCRLNFMDTIQFALTVQRIFCISPFVKDGKTLVASQLLTGYSIVAIVSYVIAIVFSILCIKSQGFDWLDLSQGYLWIIIVCFEIVFTIVSFPILLLVCLVSKHRQIQLLSDIARMDEVLIAEFGVTFNPVYLRFVVSQRVEIFLCSTYFVYIFLLLHGALQNHNLTSLPFYVFVVAYILEQYVSALLFWAISNTALMLRSKYVVLTQIQDKMFRNPHVDITVTKRKLSTLMASFKDICFLVDLISQNIGAFFVIRMAHDFTLLTSQCYLIFYILTKNTSSRAITVVLHLVVYMMQNVMRIGVTTVTMSRTVDEVS